MSLRSNADVIGCQSRPFRILLLGQNSVGKSALVVRFLTHRYIGDYDPSLERLYNHTAYVDGQCIFYEIFDTAGQVTDQDERSLHDRIQWADAYLIVYSVTDRCSYDECTRLKFLITYTRRQQATGKRLPASRVKHSIITLLGNKCDLIQERVVTGDECLQLAAELGGDTVSTEISVSECSEKVQSTFQDLYRRVAWATQLTQPSSNQKSKAKAMVANKALTRSQSLEQPPEPINIPTQGRLRCRERMSISTSCPLYNDILNGKDGRLIESDENEYLQHAQSGCDLSPKQGHAKRIIAAFWSKKH